MHAKQGSQGTSVGRFFTFVGLLLGSQAPVLGAWPPVELKSSVSKVQPFIEHTGQGPWDNWVGVPLPFKPVEKLRIQIEKLTGASLKHRGEAHITLLTPPEVQTLKPALDMAAIHKLVVAEIPKVRFQSLCLGRGEARVGNRVASTFFVVVQSADLLRLRQKIAAAAPKAGFNPGHYFPHITVGFSDKDLHLDDGVIKGVQSCIAPIELSE